MGGLHARALPAVARPACHHRAPYDRAPSPEFLKHLRLAGILEPLLSLAKEKTGELRLDLHFRRNDEIHVYCGMTRILIAKFLRGRSVRITAHRTYATQACARDLFRTWRIGESGFRRALSTYVHGVKVGARWTKAEGAIQNAVVARERTVGPD